MAVKRARPRRWRTWRAAAGVSRALVSLVMRDSPQVSPHRRGARARRRGAARLPPQRDGAQPRQPPDEHGRRAAQRPPQPVLRRDRGRASRRSPPSSATALLLITGGRRPGRERAMLDGLLEYRTDGIILVSPAHADGGRSPPRRPARRRSSSGAACAAAVDCDPGRRGGRAPGSRSSTWRGLGHRRIVHVDGGRGAGAAPRRAGYREGDDASSGSPPRRVVAGEFTEEAGVARGRAMLAAADLPTAVFAANDLVAAGVLDRLEDDGVRVPGDVSIVGFDNTFLAALHHMSLTTIDQPRARDGAARARAAARAPRRPRRPRRPG